jgi:hypothetical protein
MLEGTSQEPNQRSTLPGSRAQTTVYTVLLAAQQAPWQRPQRPAAAITGPQRCPPEAVLRHQHLQHQRSAEAAWLLAQGLLLLHMPQGAGSRRSMTPAAGTAAGHHGWPQAATAGSPSQLHEASPVESSTGAQSCSSHLPGWTPSGPSRPTWAWRCRSVWATCFVTTRATAPGPPASSAWSCCTGCWGRCWWASWQVGEVLLASSILSRLVAPRDIQRHAPAAMWLRLRCLCCCP